MEIDRRAVVAGVAALSVATTLKAQKSAASPSFPVGFLWGAATAGHQVEGNNVNSDQWMLETVAPRLSANPSGDACNSFELWRTDLDIVKSLGLSCYRFSVEWSRVEPEDGMFSRAMLDHYKAIVDGCLARGIRPIVTLCHFTTPRWFAARGGWLDPQSPTVFARYCDRAIRHLGTGIAYLTTFNEPNNAALLQSVFPPQFWLALRASLAACAKASGSERFRVSNLVLPEDVATVTRNMIAAHRAGKAAVKAVFPDLPVGVTLAVVDDQASGEGSVRDAKRVAFYDAWLRTARDDDYVGVQNYERAVWGRDGKLPIPKGAPSNYSGKEIYPASLANAVRYVHAATKVPILVTEHGIGTTDDRLRAQLIPAALAHLKAAIAEGVPVKGYVHWSLLDNYEWGGEENARFGLVAVDRTTFRRTPKPSATILSAFATGQRT